MTDLGDRLRASVADVAMAPDLWERTRARTRGAVRRHRVRQAGTALAVVALVLVLLPLLRPPGAVDAFRPADVGTALELPAPGTWSTPSAAPIPGRVGHSATWAGDRMLVWGGWAPGRGAVDGTDFATGAQLVPAADGWLPMADAPIAPRHGHAAVWTGRELLVWGGVAGVDGSLTDGAAYDPAMDRWRVLAAAPLVARVGPAAVWSGTEMVIWGGESAGRGRADGAAYDPLADRWRRIADARVTAEPFPVAVWTGTQVLIWGKMTSGPAFPSGGAAYDPVGDRWSVLSDAPVFGAEGAVSAWTGRELLVWGGVGTFQDSFAQTLTNAGAAYNPTIGRWRALAPAPLAQRTHSVGVWDGDRLIVIGGTERSLVRTDSAAYDPAADRWSALPPLPVDGRLGATAVWGGDRLLLWGGARQDVPGHPAELLTYAPDPDAPDAPDTPPSGPTVVPRVAGGRAQVLTQEGLIPLSDHQGDDVAVALRPGATAEHLDAVILWERGDDRGWPVMALSRRASYTDATLLSPVLTSDHPPVPRFAPGGQEVAWLEHRDGEVVFVDVPWSPSGMVLSQRRDTPLDVPAGVPWVLDDYSGTQLAGGGESLQLQLADPTGLQDRVLLQGRRPPGGRAEIDGRAR